MKPLLLPKPSQTSRCVLMNTKLDLMLSRGFCEPDILETAYFHYRNICCNDSFFLSSLWLMLPALIFIVFGGWPRKIQTISPQTSSSSSDETFLPLLHTFAGKLMAILADFPSQNKEQKKKILESWEKIGFPLQDRDTYEKLLQESQDIFLSDTIHLHSESIIHLQKAFYKLPYLRILLLNVIEKTEEATNTLISSFISLSEQNRLTLEEVKKRLEENKGDSLSQILEQTSAINESYYHMRQEYENLVQKNQSQITDLTNQIHTIFEQLRSINDILGQNKIIAVNLSIEEVKFGEQGRAIKVIVREIQKLNQKIDQFTAEVSHKLEHFERFNKELWNSWIAQMENSMTQFQKASENASILIAKLRDASQHMMDISSLLQENATNMQKDLDAIVESLQFQDITRQQIENVMSYLGQIQDNIKQGSEVFTALGMTFDEWDMDKMDEAKNDLIREAKISSERFLLK
ncbi:methyl-accepting chemotaxis protein [Thermospira aquatica]|uniref:Methyl-accepting transducer domain-containing protein n=1 Tax=Thermospira aquatica TaxID=2828656 RepID=A0AAX3BDP2_9SPIR|nr:methyl-accepting chemotaxis protein [Thermospira aquatica]URA10370.1 hypothetical protein KDW03_00770 [Thermospira aquatica]